MSDPIDVQIVTLTRAELYGLLQQAAQRGAELALAKAKAAEGASGGLVNRGEMAQLLGVSVATLDRLIADGLPFVRVGSHRKFNRDGVQAWLDQRGLG